MAPRGAYTADQVGEESINSPKSFGELSIATVVSVKKDCLHEDAWQVHGIPAIPLPVLLRA